MKIFFVSLKSEIIVHKHPKQGMLCIVGDVIVCYSKVGIVIFPSL